MARTLVIGGLDIASFALREGPALPLLQEEVPVQGWVTDCLTQVVAERRGVVLLSPHGAGKSVALAVDVQRFEAAENARRTQKEHSYVPRRIVPVTTLRVEDPRALYIALYQAAFDVLPADRVYRRTKTADELRDELIARCEEENVVAFAVDEAQTLAVEVLEALRDIMAVSETKCATRLEQAPDGPRIRPGGIGVLLLGTLALAPKLTDLEEYGRRWIRTEVVGALEEADVPGIMRRLLGAFEVGARTMGPDEWQTLVRQTLTRGRGLPISTLNDVARAYIRRAAAEQPKARKLDELTWDRELFQQACRELVGLQLLGQEAA